MGRPCTHTPWSERGSPGRTISKMSPTEIIFGHQHSDTMPVFRNTQTMFNNEKVLHIWWEEWSQRKHAKDLAHLQHGDKVFVQNQTGNHPGKWDRTGVIVKCRLQNQYTVKNDAACRLTLRNRPFLKKFIPSGKDVLL